MTIKSSKPLMYLPLIIKIKFTIIFIVTVVLAEFRLKKMNIFFCYLTPIAQIFRK